MQVLWSTNIPWFTRVLLSTNTTFLTRELVSWLLNKCAMIFTNRCLFVNISFVICENILYFVYAFLMKCNCKSAILRVKRWMCICGSTNTRIHSFFRWRNFETFFLLFSSTHNRSGSIAAVFGNSLSSDHVYSMYIHNMNLEIFRSWFPNVKVKQQAHVVSSLELGVGGVMRGKEMFANSDGELTLACQNWLTKFLSHVHSISSKLSSLSLAVIQRDVEDCGGNFSSLA